jgi:pyruvate dehydrogenase E2 component (dihydrolipoamide acetyltransferase)
MEYASPGEGVLLKIVVQPGKTVALNAPIAVLGEKGEKVDLEALKGTPEKPEAQKADSAKASKEAEQAPKASEDVKKVESTKGSSGEPASGRIKISPLARKKAAEKGTNLKAIQGSGPGGRIVAKDIDSAASTVGFSSSRPEKQLDTELPLTMMRKTIAKRLLSGKNEAPHFYLSLSVNMGQMLAWRRDLNENSEKGNLPKVSVNDLVIMACAKALRKHRTVNSSWRGDYILQYGQVDIAMAVALPSGLVTPVIRQADRLGVREIATMAKSLGQKARDGQLTPEDYSGGSFTISNLGMTDIEEFTAIINPPQACILAVGTIIPKPWVDGDGNIVVQQRMKMTMSCDHRVVDGMVGAKFLETLKHYLENPLMMLA